MDFQPSERAAAYIARIEAFLEEHVHPVEEAYHRELGSRADRWVVLPIIDALKAKARAEGLWNLFLPDDRVGAGLSLTEYAPLAERMGHSAIAPEVFNCNAPDTGNMEVLYHFGTEAQKARWLQPLLRAEIRSAFCMTEPEVACSDATNVAATVQDEGDTVVLHGRKWWSTGVGHPNCRLLLFLGKSDATAGRHQQHTLVLVPRDTPGVNVVRMLPAMGRYDEPYGHGEVHFDHVRVPRDHVVGDLGWGFAIAQGRLGPGRIHHAMRLIGLAERALAMACTRGTERVAFGKPLINLGGNRERVADLRIRIDAARLMVLHTAWKIEREGAMAAMREIAQIKVLCPNVAQDAVDFSMQIHGAAGLSDDLPLAAAWTMARALRLADGPDEVHRGLIARMELAAYGKGER
jgi:alkylation response protein AidB-like acyl-CoA dehydrogenase